MSTSSAITNDVVVQWNSSVEQGGLNQYATLEIENGTWLKGLPASWNPWEPQYEKDPSTIREVSRATSNPSQRQFFCFSRDETVTIKMKTYPEQVIENFTITHNDQIESNRHLVIQLFGDQAEFSSRLEGPTTFERVTNTLSQAAGIAHNFSLNAIDSLASTPNALATAANRLGATASKVIYG